MDDFEKRLQKLRLVAPGREYTSHARSLIRSAGPRRSRAFTWALAASLALSLGANFYLLSLDDLHPSPRDEPGGKASTAQVHDVYVPGGRNVPYLKVKERS